MKKRHLTVAVLISVLIVAAFAAATIFLGGNQSPELFAGKVGLIEIKGIISQPGPALKALVEFRYNDDISAVVLRIDSPGGGVGASQEIYREIGRLKKTKPVVASMGGVAASGGYYVAAPCTKIVANPGTITGSIGVISSIPNLKELFEKIGVKMQVVKSGSLKGTGQIDRPLNPAERAMIQEALDDVHTQFINDVALSRGLPQDKVRALATGAIYTGQKAKELGLVDKMGNLIDAVNLAAKLGNIEGRPELVQPSSAKKSWLQRFFGEQSRSLIQELINETMPSGLMYLYRPALAGQ